jgi:transcriptional regulator with XRE-family HTH domain
VRRAGRHLSDLQASAAPPEKAEAPARNTGGRKTGQSERKRATEVDTAIGTKVRLRRAELGITQTQLANAIGVTFQQVQKYERGTDRIGASRLAAVAAALDVPVSYFFDESAEALEEGGLAAFLHEPSSIALLEAFAEIQDLRQRRCVIDLVRALGGARQTAKKAEK